jgi:3-methyladenine DNA glycosylase AlkD
MKKTTPSLPEQVEAVITWLKRRGTKRNRDGIARYGITSANVQGVSVADIRALGKKLGRNHALALALWQTGVYEARMLAAFVADSARITSAEMDRWCRDFDSWAICDTVCFHLFDRTSRAFTKVVQWSDKRAEFEKRAAFALLASLALHDKKTGDEPFLKSLPLIERVAADDRNFVKKGVSWALRGVGRRNRELNAAAVKLARRLAASSQSAPRWIGKDALKELTSPKMKLRLGA